MSQETERLSNRITLYYNGLSRRKRKTAVQLLSLAIGLVGWELLGRYLGSILFAPVSEVAVWYYDLAVHGPMFPVLISSLKDMFLAFGLAVLVAVPVGLLMGRSKFVEHLLEPWISALFVTATAALLPLFIVVFGIDLRFRIAVIWYTCVFHILLNVYHGAKGIDQSYVDVGTSFAASDIKKFTSIVLPATLPFIMAGLRMGSGRAIRGLILAELYIIYGYGGLIGQYGRQVTSTAAVLALILTIMFLGLALRTVMVKVQYLVAPWSKEVGGEAV